MNGIYEIYYACERKHAEQVQTYLRHYDVERIDPGSKDESWFTLFGKCDASELNDIMYGIVHELKNQGVSLVVKKYIWSFDE